MMIMSDDGGITMQYWVDAQRLNDFIALRGMTIDDVEAECSTKGRHDVFQRLVTEGGPTREFFLIGEIGRAIRIPDPEFVKYKREEGDKTDDLAAIKKKQLMPLDYDESHYIDQSMGIGRLKKRGII